MITEDPAHTARRAGSFGAAASAYDLRRPCYPQALINPLVDGSRLWVLEIGAGTGIASAQLRAAGAHVLAMAEHGVHVSNHLTLAPDGVPDYARGSPSGSRTRASVPRQPASRGGAKAVV